MSVYIIAEAGVNHNGSIENALRLIDIAVESGADAVKFQTFNTDALVTKDSKKARYQLQTTSKEESQYEMLKKLELGHQSHFKLKEYCENNNIDFLSTAFDHESLHFLYKELGVKKLKIPSGEITNAPLMLEHANTHLDLILSTGMATLDEIRNALGVIAFGYINNEIKVKPSLNEFSNAYNSEHGQHLLKEKVTILHCTSEYPAPLGEINLNALDEIRTKFNLPIGYSDHSSGIVVSLAAVAKGARIIEKHFTIDKNMPGPDHQSSLNSSELKEMIKQIRNIEKALGSGNKGPSKSEKLNLKTIRKSLIANSKILKGETFTRENIAIKRPGTGKSPFTYWDFLGKQSKKDYEKGDFLE
tara:strand:- start:17 stop:1093 length:1077 start_codon:yes stop_codon:yes gene_type:complete